MVLEARETKASTNRGAKLVLPGDEISLIGNPRPHYMSNRWYKMGEIGHFGLNGHNLPSWGGYLLTEQGITQVNEDEIRAIMKKDELVFSISILGDFTRRLDDESDDSHERIVCHLLIEGADLALTSPIYLGNPELPEESFDFVENWTNPEGKRVGMYARATNEILGRFEFAFTSV